MKNIIFSVYTSFSKKTDIIEVDSWNSNNFIKNINILLKPNNNLIYIYKKTLPGNRLPFIYRLNEKLFKFILHRIVEQFKLIKVLWIWDPDYYELHNNTNYEYLVFACSSNIISDKNRQFFYKNWLAAGWVFAYNFKTGECHTSVFKHLSEKKIIQSL